MVYMKYFSVGFPTVRKVAFSQRLCFGLVLFRFFWSLGAWRRPDGRLTASMRVGRALPA